MKLYFYFMKIPFSGEPYIELDECEVIEKLKTYYPKTGFPANFYGCYVNKNDIGTLIDSCSKVVILTEKNTELAMKIFKDAENKKIKQAEENIEVSKSKLRAIENFRKESE